MTTKTALIDDNAVNMNNMNNHHYIVNKELRAADLSKPAIADPVNLTVHQLSKVQTKGFF